MTTANGAVDTVVVPLDGSALAWPALRVAAALSRNLEAGIHLVSAVPSDRDIEERDAELAIASLDLPRRPIARSVVVDPDPAQAILRIAARSGRHVVCMASHGRGRSAGSIGSAATAVMARSRSPVVLTCPMVDHPAHGRGVIACVDGDPASTAVVSAALAWAERLDQPPVVVTVAEARPGPVARTPVHRRFGPDGDVENALEELVAPFRSAGHEVATLVLYDPISPSSGLNRYLVGHPARLLVAGSGAHTGPQPGVYGNVAASIVRHSPSPVLMTRREDR